ncbi:MAG TPA: CPBP family intramembrane glutamic endopeptidase [Candidatus Lumbricidophila sp.]|nr:CPBP family intramembrane glutamic endopeptidase [Candidatus Lumbricidophila sp.]
MHPVAWLVIGVIGVFAASGVVGGLSKAIPVPPVGAAIISAAALAVYWLLMRFVARRRTPELSGNSGRELFIGIGIGAGLLLASLSIVSLSGGYNFTWIANGDALWRVLGATLATAVVAAVVEELLFRGIFTQAVERLGGTWVAVVLSAVLFGFIHGSNPGSTLWSNIAIALEAGVLLAAVFIWRRSLWAVIGLHFAWNFLLAISGIPVSGTKTDGLFRTTTSGADILTGGNFGLEASIVPVVLSLAISAAVLVAAYKRGNIVSFKNRAALEQLR